MISTRTLFFENSSRSWSTSVLSSCSLFLRKSVSGRWGLRTAACARLIQISTFDLLYIVLPKGSTMRLPSFSICRLIVHDQTPVVLLIIHSIGHLWMMNRNSVNCKLSITNYLVQVPESRGTLICGWRLSAFQCAFKKYLRRSRLLPKSFFQL